MGALVTRLDRTAVKLVYAQRKPRTGKVATLALRLLGIHIPPHVDVGAGLKLPHSTTGCVVNPLTSIGERVTLFHGSTIGRSDIHDPTASRHSFVVIEDDVIISVGAVVLAKSDQTLTVGRGSVVGANAVLTRSTGEWEVWAGAPARKVGDRPH